MTGQKVLEYLSELSEEQLCKPIVFRIDDWFSEITDIKLAETTYIQLYDEDESEPIEAYSKEEVEDILSNDYGYVSCNKGDIILYQ